MKKKQDHASGSGAEKSCGAVLYKLVDGKPLYVLVRGTVFGFPKGHVESGESEVDTASREVYEETGVRALFDAGFRRRVIYRSPRFKNGRKNVIFFLAKCPEDQEPAAQNEIKLLVMKPLDEALRLLRLDTLKQVLLDADAYLRGTRK